MLSFFYRCDTKSSVGMCATYADDFLYTRNDGHLRKFKYRKIYLTFEVKTTSISRGAKVEVLKKLA